jgi:DNA repair exonuclease SbcCD ATPase subunit
MLDKLTIRNFQSLEQVEFDLTPLTIIKGASDTGKSAVVRALRCLLLNRFQKGFITQGKGRCAITLAFDGKHTVSYDRNSHTVYRLDTQEYNKVARDVPEDIRAALAMGRVRFDKGVDLELSTQGQFDPPFLLTEPGHTVAKVIGRISNLNHIFIANSIATKELHSLTLKIGSSKESLAREESALAPLSHVPALREHIDKARKSLLAVEALCSRRDAISGLLDTWGRLVAEAKKLNSPILDFDTATLSKELTALERRVKERAAISDACRRHREAEAQTPPTIRQVTTSPVLKKLDTLEHLRSVVRPVSSRLALSENELATAKTRQAELAAELSAAKAEAINSVGSSLCPITNGPLAPQCRALLEKELA